MLLLSSFLLDLMIGDPRWLPHPVVQIGRLISFLEKRLLWSDSTNKKKLINGCVLVISVMTIVCWCALIIVHFSFYLHHYLGYLVTVILLSTTLAARSLQEAAIAVLLPLQVGDLPGARLAVGMIVGRDTTAINEQAVVRATIETVAENTVDGVTAPMFYALLGGVPLALLYKAINTMDSMLGYKNEKYLFFGRAAARLDDFANWLPARLTVPVMLLAAAVLNLNIKAASRAAARDARKHPSPNSGWAEATTAGALGIRLGGENRYGGQVSKRPELWSEGRSAEAADIWQAIRFMRVTAVLFLLFGLGIRATFLFFWRKAGY